MCRNCKPGTKGKSNGKLCSTRYCICQKARKYCDSSCGCGFDCLNRNPSGFTVGGPYPISRESSDHIGELPPLADSAEGRTRRHQVFVEILRDEDVVGAIGYATNRAIAPLHQRICAMEQQCESLTKEVEALKAEKASTVDHFPPVGDISYLDFLNCPE